ncbi:MAG: hypothetical protein QOF89_2058 [Acidobacteriota bacterium]|nr:hypothetical protein [Acidobacteriota bacterium]
MDVFPYDPSLVADEPTRFVAIQPVNVRNLVELLASESEEVERVFRILLDEQSCSAEDPRRSRRHWQSS